MENKNTSHKQKLYHNKTDIIKTIYKEIKELIIIIMPIYIYFRFIIYLKLYTDMNEHLSDFYLIIGNANRNIIIRQPFDHLTYSNIQ